MRFLSPRFLSSRQAAILAGGFLALCASPALADKIKNPTAVFAGLDKITGRTIAFEVAVDETVQFGSLQLTPRVCYTRPSYEAPQTTSFVEVDEITLANDYKRLFTGWMFAASPGLNAIEHAIYDIWLTDCKGGTDIIKTPPEAVETPTSPPPEIRQPPRRPPPIAGQRPLDPNDPNAPRPQPSQRFFPTNVPPTQSGAPLPSNAPPRPPRNVPDPTREGSGSR